MRRVGVIREPRLRLSPRLVLLAGVFWVVGCNQTPNGTVTGKVTYKGKPVPEAAVMFVPAAGPAAAGVTNDEGVYELTSRKMGDGVIIGDCKIGVYPADMERPRRAVPMKYHDPESSGLTATVGRGANVVDLDLKDK